MERITKKYNQLFRKSTEMFSDEGERKTVYNIMEIKKTREIIFFLRFKK